MHIKCQLTCKKKTLFNLGGYFICLYARYIDFEKSESIHMGRNGRKEKQSNSIILVYFLLLRVDHIPIESFSMEFMKSIKMVEILNNPRPAACIQK